MKILLIWIFIRSFQQIQGQCSGGIWPIQDETIGSFNISWRYNIALNTVQFLIQGQVNSSINLTSTYIAIGWSDATSIRNKTDLAVFYPNTGTIEDRYSHEQDSPLVDTHQDFCLIQTNVSDENISVIFERYQTTEDVNDINLNSNVSLTFFMGFYTDEYHLELPFVRQSLNTTINLLSCNSSARNTTDCSRKSCSYLQNILTDEAQCVCFSSDSCKSISTTSSISAIIDGSCQNQTNPCSSNGICLQISSTHFICQCKPDYTGVHCQISLFPSTFFNKTSCSNESTDKNCKKTEIDPCLNNPCQNNGNCLTSSNGYICKCLSPYGGTNCDSMIDICASNPCVNQGKCVQYNETYRCESIDNCLSSPCQNGGTCFIDTSSSENITQRCLCSDDYTGRYCEIEILSNYSCENSSCHYLSTCQPIGKANPMKYKCVCPEYLTGDRCQYTNVCQKKPCLNQGTCVPLGEQNSFMCLCPPGFGHFDCSIYLGESCASNVCLNGGRCETNNSHVQCVCSEGFAGPRCEWRSVCSANTCQNGGICRQIAPTMAECLCRAGFTGPTCSLGDSCMTSPCQNGGGCTTLLADTGTTWSAYRCICPSGFYGQHCDTKISSCSDMICPSYKICTEQSSGPVCTCAGNRIGSFCQYDNPCSPSSMCQNAGTCVPSNTDPSASFCLCEEGYTGRFCEKQIEANPCASNPCQTRGYCALSSSNQTYTCVCQENFTGEQCERSNPCASSPCLNQGLCQAKWNRTDTWFTCQCTGAFTGSRCETSLLNPCGGLCMNGSPCNNGVCICPAQFTGTFCEFRNPCYEPICKNNGICSVISNPTNVSFTCACPHSYTGQYCEISLITRKVDQCTGQCQNGGSCANGICMCTSKYIGPECQYENPCNQRNPCLNNGTCFGRYETNGNLSTQCLCSEGHTGNFCESILCSSSSCNGGVCRATQNTIVCVCSAGRFGDRCQYKDACATNPCASNERCEQIETQYQCISCYDKSSYCSIYQLRNEYCDNRYTILVNGSFLPVPQACQRSCGQCIPVQRFKDISSLFKNSTNLQYDQQQHVSNPMRKINHNQLAKCIDKRDDCLMQKAYGFCRIFNEKYPDECMKTCHPDCAIIFS